MELWLKVRVSSWSADWSDNWKGVRRGVVRFRRLWSDRHWWGLERAARSHLVLLAGLEKVLLRGILRYCLPRSASISAPASHWSALCIRERCRPSEGTDYRSTWWTTRVSWSPRPYNPIEDLWFSIPSVSAPGNMAGLQEWWRWRRWGQGYVEASRRHWWIGRQTRARGRRLKQDSDELSKAWRWSLIQGGKNQKNCLRMCVLSLIASVANPQGVSWRYFW